MCGIAGVYEYGGGDASVAVLAGMLGAIDHRGPDDRGSFVDGPIGIGNTRLSIIDIEGGHQPIANEDGTVITVFNGEIYNARSLAARLHGAGHSFKTECDTETIVHLYEERGDDFVSELRGMFAIAIWDTKRQRLVLARDRLGIKPLYFTDDGNRLTFASEIKSLLCAAPESRRVDFGALTEYLGLKYVPAPRTLFEGVHALPPGHLLVCDADGIRITRYWDLSFVGESVERSEDSWAEELRELLWESVRLHLVSDVPFGAFLSGGLDSSTIVAIMSQLLSQPVRTFSVGYDGEGAAFSELPYARLVAQRYETDHHEIVIQPEDFVSRLANIIWHLDQPIADEACLPNAMVSELAADHVKMVLTGEGGDELFAGYARYSGERLSPFATRVPRSVRSAALATAGHLRGLRRPKLALYALCQPDEARRFAAWFPLFNDARLDALKTPRLDELDGGASTTAAFAQHLDATDARDPLSRMLYVDTKMWLPDDLLARGDKTSMSASLEARVPLLDHVLVEFAASVPPHLKLRGRTRKYLLRQVARDLLPNPISNRKKQGFPTPVSLWFKGPAREFLRDNLSSSVVRDRGLFDAREVGRLLDEHDTGRADHGSLLFGLLSLELWHQLFIDTPALSVASR
jgi:asparagine synthase (glutamine-hydrolysing)